MTRDLLEARLPFRNRLAFRFGVVLCVGVAALFFALSWWNVTTQRRHMVSLTEQAAQRCSTVIRSATRDGMLHNEPERVGAVVQTIASTGSVRSVRVIDREGRVRHAAGSRTAEKVVPIEAFQCQLCHARNPVPARLTTERPMRELRAEDGTPYLHVVTPIPNEPACTVVCHEKPHHPPDRRILGIIDIELPLSGMVELLEESETQLGIGLGVTLVALVLLTLFLTWNWVLKPVRRLAVATESVAAGDLSTRVPETSRDEIGRMAASWNSMVTELQRARTELEEWSYTLEHRVDEKTEEVEEAHRRMLVVEKMAALGKLAAVVAHEINNPLTGIATYARLMRKRCQDAAASGNPLASDENLRALELMETEAARCGNIVRNLLLFSRTPGARFAEEDLRPILDRCVLLVQHKAELQDVEVQTDFDDDSPRVVCDASQIQQIVLSLVMNALESMPDGGVLTISLERDPSGDGVVLEVSDTGVGIAPEALPHIYEPFYTTKEQGEGVGLGLSVVYGIVERHTGRLDVASKPGQGTWFRVHLPPTQPTSAPEAARPEEGAAS